jgi:hypothetical protein
MLLKTMRFVFLIALAWFWLDGVFPEWGARGSEFESRRPDQQKQALSPIFGLGFLLSDVKLGLSLNKDTG